MPASTMAPAQQRGAKADTRQVVAMTPFIRASSKHREPAGIDISRPLTGTSQDLTVSDIPAYGFLRAVLLVVTATGGAGTGVVATEDAPFNVLNNIALTEPNGTPIVQFTNGYHCYLADKWGGYAYVGGADMKASPTYSAPSGTGGNFSFLLRIPVELSGRDSVGSLPNLNSAATFKLRLGLAASTAVYSTAPTTLPTIRVRAYLEAWEQPAEQEGGLANQTVPPAVNTTQFWSEQSFNVSQGAQTVRLTRVGNWLRNVVFVYRRAGTSRTLGHADFPDPVQLNIDARVADIVERNNWLHQMYERSGFGGAQGTVIPALDAPQGLDSGVFVYDFTHEFDGSLGYEQRDLWQPTYGSTRLEIQGTFAQAGVLTVLTNDVAIAGNVFM